VANLAFAPSTTPDLPEDVLALLDHHLLDLGGPYGAEPVNENETVGSGI